MKRPRSTRMPSLEMSLPSISRPLRYFNLHVLLFLFLSYSFNTVKYVWICFPGWSVYSSSCTTGLIHASSYSSNIQVSQSHSDFHLFFPVLLTLSCLTCLFHLALVSSAAASCPDWGDWNQELRPHSTASCWTASAAGARLPTSWNSSLIGSQRLCQSKGSVNTTPKSSHLDMNVWNWCKVYENV